MRYSVIKESTIRHAPRMVLLCLTALLFAGSGCDFGNSPPSATIVSPQDGQQFSAGESILFQADAQDAEDGALDNASISWSSHLDGALGTGRSFFLNTLSEGEHVITLTAVDSQNKAAQDFIDITVVPADTVASTTTAPPAYAW